MHAFVRYGDLMGDLFIPELGKSNGMGIVWCPGLPNRPTADDLAEPLAHQGFTVLQARYPGSWQSYGRFGPSSSLDGAVLGLELMAQGSARDLVTERPITWTVDRLALVGNSYGGGVAICALALSDLADCAVVFCPLVEPHRQNADAALPEDDLRTLYPYLKRCHENVFRGLDDREWGEFLAGTSRLFPPAYVPTLLSRPLLLVHGSDDQTIRPYHTAAFYEQLVAGGADRAALILAPAVGHGRALRAKTWDQWTQWLLR